MNVPPDTTLMFEAVKLNESILSSHDVGDGCSTDEARQQLQQGVGRRIRIVQIDLRSIAALASPDRTDPLRMEEQDELNLHLNSLYFHLRGILDNLAWALQYEKKLLPAALGQEETIMRKVGLFSSPFQAALQVRCVSLFALLTSKATWNQGLKELRDPIAHRIPIYAIPQFLTAEESIEYQRKLTEAEESSAKLDFQKSDEIQAEIDRIGTYEPAFYYSDFRENRIYLLGRQIAEDIQNMREIMAASLECISAGEA